MDYTALVHRVRELVWEHVPAGSTVAVVSKGDPALILFDQRHGWHYPQTGTGQYLGHHPETAAAAVAHLEALRMRGAKYLVVPSIYGWFLDYYTDLRAHLSREGELVYGGDVCKIYSLAKRDLATMPNKTAPERQLRELIEAVLAPGSSIVALGWSHGALAECDEFVMVEPPAATAGRGRLEASLRSSGADYVVIPASAKPDPIAGRLRATWTTVLDQKHVCAVLSIPPAASVKR